MSIKYFTHMVNFLCRENKIFWVFISIHLSILNLTRVTSYLPHVLCSNLTNYMEQSPSSVTQLIKKFPAFYNMWRFIAMFTRPHQWILSWARWIQFTFSDPISWRFISVLSTHLCLDFPSGFFLLLPICFSN